MWFQLASAGKKPTTLRWEDGHLSGEGPAIEFFHERMANPEPVWFGTQLEFPPGFDTFQQFLATASEMAPEMEWSMTASPDADEALAAAVSVPEGATP